jgi:GTP-binding protein HflX
VANHGLIEVLNKIDLLPVEARHALKAQVRDGDRLPVSAATGEGTDAILTEIDRRLALHRDVAEYRLPHREGGAIAWLYSHGTVVERHDDERFAYLTVSLMPEERARFERLRRKSPGQSSPGRSSSEHSET